MLKEYKGEICKIKVRDNVPF